jgi:hypothetical protein
MGKDNRSFTFYDIAKLSGFGNDDWLQVIWYKLCKNYCKIRSSIHNLWTSNHYIAMHDIKCGLNKATHYILYFLIWL